MTEEQRMDRLMDALSDLVSDHIGHARDPAVAAGQALAAIVHLLGYTAATIYDGRMDEVDKQLPGLQSAARKSAVQMSEHIAHSRALACAPVRGHPN